ncbi:MAG: hypothetical protein I3273_06840 [Candidatus Moeniiplasma glomeromycotorum]|nr:hypothetical protein [Candidatus Moeniiplasma glomeromycotorum]MCE8168157.1 hypothetical protein [Candidatus Moeniiplasma glomeromycotorum]MCE8169802.1 hypothetical protein [Candidatus Moeniiplasma glomeromycotorum]
MVLQILTAFIGLIGATGFGTGAFSDEEDYWEGIQSLEQQIEEQMKERTTNTLNNSKGLEPERAKSNYKTINQADKVHFGLKKTIF